MKNFVYDIYSKYFSKKQLYRFHKFLFGLSVRGLGLLNYKSSKISGEKYLIDRFLNLSLIHI